MVALDGNARVSGEPVVLATGPDEAITHPRILWTSTHHSVAWMDALRRIHLARLDRELGAIGAPLIVATTAASESDLAIAGDAASGWIANRSEAGQLRVEHLGESEPTATIDVASIGEATDISLAVLGGRPVAAWLDPDDPVV